MAAFCTRCNGVMLDLGSPAAWYGITIVESTDDESLDQTGGCLFIENASLSFQASKVSMTYTGSLADVFLR